MRAECCLQHLFLIGEKHVFSRLPLKNESYYVRYNYMVVTANVFDMCDNGRFLAFGVQRSDVDAQHGMVESYIHILARALRW